MIKMLKGQIVMVIIGANTIIVIAVIISLDERNEVKKMGGDNFNKKSDDTGGIFLSDADRFLAAINTGKKHRQSTPERLEQIAMKKLNQIVDMFIEKMQILTQMENAAVKGESSIEIEWHSFIQHLDADAEVAKLHQNPKNARQFSNSILCVVDSGGSGISVTKDVYQFFRALIQRFMPEIFARPMSPMDAPAESSMMADSAALLGVPAPPSMPPPDAPPTPPGMDAPAMPPMPPMLEMAAPPMPPMPEEMPPISSGIEVNVIGFSYPYSIGIPLQLKVFENQSIPDMPKYGGITLEPKVIRISW
jgi:hypothetical protein